MLPVISSCPECGQSETLSVLSRSPATDEVLVRCECGAEYWDTDRDFTDDYKVAA
jgi:uncharacterized Zn finger protein